MIEKRYLVVRNEHYLSRKHNQHSISLLYVKLCITIKNLSKTSNKNDLHM